jgi:L-threonylcarbamoyladenylate synthase
MMQKEIEKSITFLKKSGIIIYPTDTIWGIGCDATNDKAVKKIYDLKRRLETKTMIVLIAHPNELELYVDEVPPIAYDLIERWEKPLTIVYDRPKNISKHLIGSDNTVAIRISKDSFSKMLIQQMGKPIVSTSANYSGETAPLFFKDIDPALLKEVDYVVNLYQNSMNEVKPSTIIRIYKDGSFEVIRP